MKRKLAAEHLESRRLMAVVVNHPPHLQLGNAPLIGTPAYNGQDQAEIIWQTVPAEITGDDTFAVEYRQAGTTAWNAAPQLPTVDTQVEGRVIHSAILTSLNWSTTYQYRVQHFRDGELIKGYDANFRTRLEPGDARPVTLAAYGDSAWPDYIDQFAGVQRRINEQNVDFALLLGDNIYPHGTHLDADGRFSAELNPTATAWNASHVDYLAVGNHDLENPIVSQQLFSVPLPDATSNAYANLPSDASPEFVYSFDYGNVHIAVMDTWMANTVETPETRQQLDAMLDFVATDMQQSTAKWKLVVAHNPFIGTDKNRHPNEYYFQAMVSRLNAVGVDLVMGGDSHTYAWTHPISGFADANQDGDLTYDEIDYHPTTNRTYTKDAGVIQLVSGVGGRDFRLGDYTEPVYAQGYSLRDFTGPVEFGYAKIEVSERELVVSYISAETGGIVGDLNGNGLPEADEPYFGQFRIVDNRQTSGDLDRNGLLNAADVDLICLAIQQSTVPAEYDLNNDGSANRADVDHLLHYSFGAAAGDANLDGVFNSSDLVVAFTAGRYETGQSDTLWSQGDWDCDGQFTTRDLVLAFQANSYIRA